MLWIQHFVGQCHNFKWAIWIFYVEVCKLSTLGCVSGVFRIGQVASIYLYQRIIIERSTIWYLRYGKSYIVSTCFLSLRKNNTKDTANTIAQLKCGFNLHLICIKKNANWALNMVCFYALVLMLLSLFIPNKTFRMFS